MSMDFLVWLDRPIDHRRADLADFIRDHGLYHCADDCEAFEKKLREETPGFPAAEVNEVLSLYREYLSEFQQEQPATE